MTWPKNEDNLTKNRRQLNKITQKGRWPHLKNWDVLTLEILYDHLHQVNDFKPEIHKGCRTWKVIGNKVCSIMHAPSKDDIKYKALFKIDQNTYEDIKICTGFLGTMSLWTTVSSKWLLIKTYRKKYCVHLLEMDTALARL